MPKETCRQTSWTSENRIELKREPGNEYINTYVPIIKALFKCNHDIIFLGAGEGTLKFLLPLVTIFESNMLRL